MDDTAHRSGPAESGSPRLSVQSLNVMRAGTRVVHDVDLTVDDGELVALLGANGAGKTTLLDGISGFAPCESGTVWLSGHAVQNTSRTRRSRQGLAHVQQGRAIFPDLTVRENLLVAAGADDLSTAFDAFPELDKLRDSAAGMISGGEQQMLVIARALIRSPKVLLIDEMSLGLAPTVVKRLFTVVETCASTGMAVLIVEQFRKLALAAATRAYVMYHGAMAYSGDCTTLRNDVGLLEDLYLGRQRSG